MASTLQNRIWLTLVLLLALDSVASLSTARHRHPHNSEHRQSRRISRHRRNGVAADGGEPSSRRDWLAGTLASSMAVTAAGGGGVTAFPSLARAGGADDPPRLSLEYFDPDAVATAPAAGRFSFPALTPPFRGRATYRYRLGRDAWALEQLLAFGNVTATIRCNVVRLRGGTGGLWVHSPQWPTGEFCELLEGIGGGDGDGAAVVEHVVLPCNAFEHKAPMRAFCQRYPHAKVWVAPGQYGPLGSCGTNLDDASPPRNLGYRVDGILGDQSRPPPPWVDEFDIFPLYVDLPRNAGPVSEVSFLHRPTKTLIATDAVVYVPREAPQILATYFDEATIGDNDPTFWPRSVLQSVFLPLRSEDGDAGGSTSAGGTRYPGYDALAGRLARAPILRAVVDARAPVAVRDWIQEQTNSKDAFDRILTSHFASPIQATPADLRACFDYLFENDVDKLSTRLPPIACQDWKLLDGINQFIAKTNAGEPAIFDFQRGCVEGIIK